MEQHANTIETVGHEWREIDDLPEDWRDFSRDDLRAVHSQWTQDRRLVKDQTKVKRFQEDLAMRWAIETGIPYSLYRMFRHMAAVRLRLMWKAGVRSWLDPVQLGGLLKSLTWAAVGALGKRSLKRSGLTRRLFAPGRDDARPRFASAHPSRPEFAR